MFEAGLEDVCADFHLHTRKDKEFKYSEEETDFLKSYIAALKKANIKVGAITNHNKFDLDEYKAIRKAANKEDIFILPGVELSVKEGANGIHTLIIFDPDAWLFNGENHIQTFLSTAFAGISHPENSNAKCKGDLKTTLETLNGYGFDYFIIFAHVDQRSGLFMECAGGVLEPISKISSIKNRVLGLQKSRTKKNVDKFKKYFGYIPALVEGSDPKSIHDIGKGDKKTYLKIGEYSYSAVKFVLQNCENRVSDNLCEVNHGYIESVSFQGGKLDGQEIRLSPGLNTLIGIRGSGKSSILEAIRYIFDIQPQADKKYKDDLVKSVLGSGGKATLTVADKHGKKYKISHIYGEQTNVIDSEDNDLNVTPLSLFDGVKYYGQKDLSESANNESEALEKLVGGKITQKPQTDDSTEEIIRLIKQLLQLKEIPEKIESTKNSIEDLTHKMSIYKERGVAEKVKKQAEFTADKVKFESVEDKVNSVVQSFKETLEENPSVSNLMPDDISEYNSDLIGKIKDILSSMDEQITQIGTCIDKLEKSYKNVRNVITEFTDRENELTDEFAEIKREINDTDLDVDGYMKLTERLEQANAQLKELEKKEESKSKSESEFKKAIRKRNDNLLETFNEYKKEVEKINQSQDEIRVELTFKGDREDFKEQMKNDFKGTGIRENKYQIMSEKFTDYPDLLGDWILDDGKKLSEILSADEYSKVVEKLQNQYEDMIKCPTKDEASIFYHGKPLKEHSIGQRASAMILFILTQDDNDIIIIDQPEDDLDNKVIYDEVIAAIVKKKPAIQFIFATHNANIPVLGDAEKVITTEFEQQKIKIENGNIDEKQTHEKIINIMEGGKEAFDRRKLIYTNWE